MLTRIKNRHPLISWADLIQMAGAFAVELSGGSHIVMSYGRVDCTQQNYQIRVCLLFMRLIIFVRNLNGFHVQWLRILMGLSLLMFIFEMFSIEWVSLIVRLLPSAAHILLVEHLRNALVSVLTVQGNKEVQNILDRSQLQR